MRKVILSALVVFLVFACAKDVPPTKENINKIFKSKDFSITFHFAEDEKETMAFRDDVLAYKTGSWTRRIEISYAEAEIINDFVQQNWQRNRDLNASQYSITIANDALTTTIAADNYRSEYYELLETLNLNVEDDVPAQEK